RVVGNGRHAGKLRQQEALEVDEQWAHDVRHRNPPPIAEQQAQRLPPGNEGPTEAGDRPGNEGRGNPAGGDPHQQQQQHDLQEVRAESGRYRRDEKDRHAGRGTDQVHQVESLRRLEDRPQAEREDDERDRDGEDEQGATGFTPQRRRYPKQVVHDERSEQRERDPSDSPHGGLARHREGRDASQLDRVPPGQVFGDELRGGASEPQVEDAEVPQDCPDETEESEALLAKVANNDRDRGHPNEQRQGLPNDVEQGVARDQGALRLS